MTYEEYYNQWQLSVESRDLAFDEWLCLRLDKQKAIDDKEFLSESLKMLKEEREIVKKEMIEKAWQYICDNDTLTYEDLKSAMEEE